MSGGGGRERSTKVITPVSGHFDHINNSDCVSSELGLIVLSGRRFCLFVVGNNNFDQQYAEER